MSIKSLLMGTVIGSVGGWLAKRWRGNKVRIEDTLTNLDNAVEQRLGIDIPDSWQRFYDGLVHKTVILVDRYACDPAFWRGFIRFLEGKPDANKLIGMVVEWLKGVDWLKPVEDQIPGWLRPLFNQFKEDFSAKVITAKIAIAVPKPAPEAPGGDVTKIVAAVRNPVRPSLLDKTNDEIHEDVRRAVVVAKLEKPMLNTVEATGDPESTWTKLLEESKKRQAILEENSKKLS